MKKILSTALMSTIAAAGIITAAAPMASAERVEAGSFGGGDRWLRCAEYGVANYKAAGFKSFRCEDRHDPVLNRAFTYLIYIR
ncbi:hypothetical protein ACFVWF_33275 [Rhodococcus qingshengii]|uniref:hypothetical protein n=1 Tax=Rhodococcus qingshengii TaxID=334542 RepID=UPI0036DF8D1F